MRLLYSFTTAAGLALASLRAHKLRTFLTLLGVIIGVFSVVVVGAAIEGLGAYAEQTTAKVFGSDSFQIGQLLQVGQMSRRERLEKLRTNKRIRVEDYAYLKQVSGREILYSPYRQRGEDIKHAGVTLEACAVIGVSSELEEIRDFVLTEGRFFTAEEERTKTPVAIIGEDVRTAFFADASPIGKQIKLGGYDFRVVGLQEKIGSAGGQSQDRVAFIPATVFNRIYGPERSMLIFARPRPESGLVLEEALDRARVALRVRYKTRPGAVDNFDTITPDSIREFINRILGVIGAAVVPITLISLVVGGIVIMNIMLVSVTERTREIGIRKSLGARQSDLMLQFLLEAVMLSLLGGGIGLAGGWAVAAVATAISGVTLKVTMPYVFLALGVSSVVGIASGWYPALRASRMNPVDALRSE
ncbi:MAG: ABC transporter permease [Bryobacteraceae bacterium]|nr:ABC transporter permease [Bryobacteraceae bacterium]